MLKVFSSILYSQLSVLLLLALPFGASALDASKSALKLLTKPLVKLKVLLMIKLMSLLTTSAREELLLALKILKLKMLAIALTPFNQSLSLTQVLKS